MSDELMPKSVAPETGYKEPNPWSERLRSLAVSQGKFNPDTDIHSLESHGKDGTHYVIGYRPHTKLAMDPECLAISTGKAADGTKVQLRFVWDESEGPEHKYASQLQEINMIISVFEPSKETNG